MGDNAAQFVGFVEKVHSERDPDMWISLKKLLVEEENEFDRSTERVRNIKRCIDEGSRRIASQKSLIERLKANGRDVRLAGRTLNDLVEIQRLQQQYYHKRARSL